MRPAILVAVGPVDDRVGGSGLESRDAGERPAAHHVLPQSLRRSRNLPQVEKGQPLAAIEVARAVIQLHPAQVERHGGHAGTCVLGADLADTLAGAIETLRPGVR